MTLYNNFMMAFILIAALGLLGLFLIGLKKGVYKQKRDKQNSIYWTARFFGPALFIIFVIRTFMFDWMIVPTASMWPNVAPGQYVLTAKYKYGVFFMPFTDKKILNLNSPQRSDPVVFFYPLDEEVLYLKRIVALPGETVIYDKNKQITIIKNTGERIKFNYGRAEDVPGRRLRFSKMEEEAQGVKYSVATLEGIAPINTLEFRNFADAFAANSCSVRNAEEIKCSVPMGSYFVMGDNRDQSLDSRYWGFVREDKIIAKAIFSCDLVKVASLKLPECKKI